jgi:hypothetical protein
MVYGAPEQSGMATDCNMIVFLKVGAILDAETLAIPNGKASTQFIGLGQLSGDESNAEEDPFHTYIVSP